MRHAQRGLSLVELLIAMTIGSVLIAGAIYVYSQSRRTHTVNDTVARLQENARYVFSVLEPDIQLAGYYGFSNTPDDFKFISSGSTAGALPASQMQAASTAVPGLDTSCGNNFTVDLIATLQGSDNSYGLPATCNPPAAAGDPADKADTLTIRRSSTPPSDGIGSAKANRLQLLVSRLSPSNQYVLADGTLPVEPALAANLVQMRDLIVRTYYISKNSTNPDAAGLPALRVKSLTDGPAFADQEVMRGVEDLQVQFGIDTGDYDGDGVIDAGRDTNGDGIPDVATGIATKYVNPDKLPVGFQVVAVRIWVLLRAEQPEQGFVNDTHYVYANRDIPPANDSFRRILVSRTIQLRNSRNL